VQKYAANDLAGAEADLLSALKSEKGFAPAELLLGKVYFFQDRELEAEALFADLVRRFPGHTEARLWNIRCLVLLGDHGAAEECLKEELALNPSDWRVYFQYALLAALRGDTETRLTMLRNAEVYLGDAGRVYLELGKVWQALGMDDRARSCVDKARLLSGGLQGTALDALAAQLRGGDHAQ
jgi:tetratricopeptide (TPR) repeat protein